MLPWRIEREEYCFVQCEEQMYKGKSVGKGKPKHSNNKTQNKSWHQSYIGDLAEYLKVYPYYVCCEVNSMFSAMLFWERVLSVP